MSLFCYSEFYDYIYKKDIIIINCNSFNVKKKITMKDAKRQLDILCELHEKIKGYEGSAGFTLPNNIGKLVENCKVEIKKNNRFIRYLENQGANNGFESLLLKIGDEHISRAEKSIECIYKSNYMDIIYRSMKSGEICVVNSSEDNLRKVEKIEIAKGKKFCYEILEIDAINYFNKLKRKNSDIDIEGLIDYFCTIEGLDENSNNFIRAMISYPFEFMKCVNRYKRSKKPWTLEKYEEKLLKSIEKDSQSYI
ncbi:hypothetical protein LGK99_07085 [Clostridium algidicarnis]|uniref:hypothetical protein n=1 Tax=Clostridium algidicarnis TaxID=37659 RepID=UPI001C0B3D00|nr:hypothetical protein [Clostridium algidicarnis]MBU3194247.1 hypothetical protein [Clostridium algidicarnis]MBU3197152.1 hypothetical protein [Clostridium algidicarnis]MBU3205931.1 hypothetical protein [Clostridium algidicarnis]MCB2286871.1 hypothetical protein [Clostridium algidicarnis]